MAQWKKVIVSGSNISDLNNNLNYVTSSVGGQVDISGNFSGTFEGDGSKITNVDFTNIVSQPTLVSSSVQVDIASTTGYAEFSASVAEASALTLQDVLDNGNSTIDSINVGGVNVNVGSDTPMSTFSSPDSVGLLIGDSSKGYGGYLSVDGNIDVTANISAASLTIGGTANLSSIFDAGEDILVIENTLRIPGISDVSASIAAAAESAGNASLDSVTSVGNTTTNDINVGGLNVTSGPDNLLYTTINASDISLTIGDSTNSGYEGRLIVDGAITASAGLSLSDGYSITGLFYAGEKFVVIDNPLRIEGISNVSASIAAAAQSAGNASLDSVTSVGNSTTNNIEVGGLTANSDAAFYGDLVDITGDLGVVGRLNVGNSITPLLRVDPLGIETNGTGFRINGATSTTTLFDVGVLGPVNIGSVSNGFETDLNVFGTTSTSFLNVGGTDISMQAGALNIDNILSITGISDVSASIAAAGSQTLQSVTSKGASTLNTISVGGLNVSGDTTVDGNLTINGTLTTINTTNTEIKDKFILLNSGSTNPDEAGLVVDEGSGTGHAFIFDNESSRWSVNQALSSGATSANPEAFVSLVVHEDVTTHNINDTEYHRVGNIKVESSGDIYIFA